MFMLDLHSKVPAYEQLKNRTLELIMVGILEPNSPMPSVRNLARDLGVNPNTIQKAYQEMEKEGIIYSVTGRGSFVTAQAGSNEAAIKSAEKRLFEAAYEARIYGIDIDIAMKAVKSAYEKE